jgi:uncharacterized membrane protein YfhO
MTSPLPALDSCQAAEYVSIRRHTANSIGIDAEPFCRGMLILADTWYPVWVATVDGQPTTIHEVYGALRGVVVPTGPHRIDFHYRPTSAWIGAVCSFLGILGACLVAVISRAGQG